MKSLDHQHVDPATLVQVEPDSYTNLRYDSKRRFCSYWHQLDEIFKTDPKTVVEVGVGSGFTGRYLQSHGIQYTSIDIDARLNPTITASVLDLPLEDNLFEVAVCFEVLEHLPFTDFTPALRELARISSGPVIISVPDATRAIRFLARLPRNIKIQKVFQYPTRTPRIKDLYCNHKWEIGVESFPLRRILAAIDSAGLNCVKTYRVFEYIRHRFFILQKQ